MVSLSVQRDSSRYLPCLLTRLTDEHPFSGNDEDFYTTSFSLEQLKQDILMNLNLVLNARTAPAESAYLKEHFPEALASGYHFGIDSCTGVAVSSLRPAFLAELVRKALVVFEPRLEADSIEVHPDFSRGEDRTAVHLSISSRLAVKPLTQDIFFRLRVDMETGETQMSA